MKRSAVASFVFLVALIGAALAGFPSSGRIFPLTGGTPPPPPSGIWTFCNTGTTGIVAPCTASGTVSNSALFTTTVTYVMRWAQNGINPLTSFGHVQLMLAKPSSGTLHIAGISIGAGQTSGGGKCSTNTSFCQWDFSATPTTVTISSATCSTGSPCNLTGGGFQLTDVIAFTGPATQPLMISMQMNTSSNIPFEAPSSTTVNPVGTGGFTLNNYNTWELQSVTQSATVQKNSGYSSTCSAGCGNKIAAVLQVIGTP